MPETCEKPLLSFFLTDPFWSGVNQLPFYLPVNRNARLKSGRKTFQSILSKVTLAVFTVKIPLLDKKKKKLNEFITASPNGKPALCLEYFRKFSVKELQGISDLLIPVFALSTQSYSFSSCHKICLWIILLVAPLKVFFLVNFQM